MRNITENSVILKTETNINNTYKFTILYADGSGILCKVSIGDNVSVKGISDKVYSNVQGQLLSYENNIVSIKVGTEVYKFKNSDLIYIYNVTIPTYNFDIVDYINVIIEDPEMPIDPSHPGSGNIASAIKILSVGTGTSLLTKTGDNIYTSMTINEGEGVKITTTDEGIVISASVTALEMSEQDVTDFIDKYINI